ncbi:hypothetical protein A2U01_0052065, partial [Trifolium medium]|nr:hypothetical protein [Trifolium medium]
CHEDGEHKKQLGNDANDEDFAAD